MNKGIKLLLIPNTENTRFYLETNPNKVFIGHECNMVNYNNGKIYNSEPIVEHDESEIYIPVRLFAFTTVAHTCKLCPMFRTFMNREISRIE